MGFEAGNVDRPSRASDWLVVCEGNGRLCPAPDGAWLWPMAEAPSESDAAAPVVPVGWLGERAVFVTGSLQETERSVALRRIIPDVPRDLASVLSGAVQRWHWWRDHQFCGRCGQTTEWHSSELALYCRTCEHRYFPRIAPCVIVAIRDEDRLLLARSHRHPPGLWSLIAGFLEPGESAEQGVRREVREETGLEVGQLDYRGSESWPFPHQLMLGFVAECTGGELQIQEDELADARWFPLDGLPDVPGPWTIAGRLIREQRENDQ